MGCALVPRAPHRMLLRTIVAARAQLTPFQALEHPWVRGDAAPASPLDASVLASLVNFSARNGLR